MQTILFHDTIFGPIHSRRLGTSLGVNLSPVDGKVCSFDCLYCEAGYNAQGTGKAGLPDADSVLSQLEDKLRDMSERGDNLDVITFSGNGEPTMHPRFADIIDGTIALRDKYFPDVKISVLTNSTRLYCPDVAAALRRVDNNIAKLDSAIDSTMRALDRPVNRGLDTRAFVQWLSQFPGQVIVQTMLTRGVHDGEIVDNTTAAEIDALIDAYRAIAPRQVMIYSLDRPTPELSLQKVPRQELQAIADRITSATGIPVSVA